MARRILATIATALRDERRREAEVHFHQGPSGLPAACHDARCSRPRLDVEEHTR